MLHEQGKRSLRDSTLLVTACRCSGCSSSDTRGRGKESGKIEDSKLSKDVEGASSGNG